MLPFTLANTIVTNKFNKDIDDKEHNNIESQSKDEAFNTHNFKFLNMKIGERNEGSRKLDQTASSLAVKT
jgi:hypothetical protein